VAIPLIQLSRSRNRSGDSYDDSQLNHSCGVTGFQLTGDQYHT
jgi:hypothetical protein